MRNVILLDLDGVLITTPPWKADPMEEDGYSSFDPAAVDNLNQLMRAVDAEVWLSSARASALPLHRFREIFRYRRIEAELVGYTPNAAPGVVRCDQLNSFLDHQSVANFLILDDDSSLHNLDPIREAFWVQTNPMIGFDGRKLEEALSIVASWSQPGSRSRHDSGT